MEYMSLWYHFYCTQFVRLIKIIFCLESPRFRGVAWYWHSVDVVRLLLFIMCTHMEVKLSDRLS